MYFGLFRVGEISKGQHAVKVNNVYMAQNKRKMLFLLRTSKTHRRGTKPQLIKICSRSNDTLNKSAVQMNSICPYSLLHKYLACRPGYIAQNEQFFIFRDYQPVKPIHICMTLRTILKLANFQPYLYNTHSFRIGRSSDLLKLGVSVNVIKKLGRWKSNIVYNYLH